MPTKGSVELDVVEGSLRFPKLIFDYKFGDAVLTVERINEIRQGGGFGLGVPIIEVKP